MHAGSEGRSAAQDSDRSPASGICHPALTKCARVVTVCCGLCSAVWACDVELPAAGAGVLSWPRIADHLCAAGRAGLQRLHRAGHRKPHRQVGSVSVLPCRV